MQIKITSSSADFTKSIGKKLSRIISKSNIILFTGELGGGKTTFISGLAEGLGLKENLSSPSFTILNEYPVSGRLKLIHADLYRIDNINDIKEIGLDDYIYDDFSVVCVEWGNKIEEYIKKEYLKVNLNYLVDTSDISTKRKITFDSNSRYWDLKLLRFKKIIGKSGK